EMRAILRAAGTPPIEVLHAAVPVVWHEFFTGEPSYSDTVSRVRACVKASGLRHVLVSAVLGWGGFAAINAGNFESGTTWARELDAEATGAGATYELASRGLAAFAALSRGDLHSARMHVDELARRGFDAGYVGDVPLGHALAAQVDVAS